MRSRFDKERRASALAILALLSLVLIFYVRLDILRGTSSLIGSDYVKLHMRRIAFARSSLLGHAHMLPGWYPHEFLGSPFAANLQSFPWIPTRLLLLLLDPSIAYAPAVVMAATLAAIFTYLYCRRAGLTRSGAVAAGGTFAGAGFFASRVMAGHLPLLEAYPSLPLLLWLVDRAISPERVRRRRSDLAAIALCSAFVVSAGHPQLPAYSLASALLYTAFRARGRLRACVASALTLGAGLTFVVWWPMLLLIGRSTRVLHLAAAPNDVAMPYRRLWALLVPGAQGWPEPMDAAAEHLFTGFPNAAYFWDTAAYIGILPLVAMGALLVACVVDKRMPIGCWKFLACLGAGAFLCALPWALPALHLLPGTLLRSPARLLYVSTFCAAVALGVAFDKARSRWPRGLGVLALIVLLHFCDLWRFSHRFVESAPLDEIETPAFQDTLDREVGNGRIAEERADLSFSYEDRYDDAGGFDSILLARFYQGLLPLAGLAPGSNRQDIDASELPVKALEATGVRFVITTKTRTDLPMMANSDEANLYRVANPAPRAEFVTAEHIGFVPEQQIADAFAASPKGRLLLPQDAAIFLGREGATKSQGAELDYERPSSDEISLQTVIPRFGFIHVLESYDPGWKATVDGVSTRVVPANGFSLAIPVASGGRRIRLLYETPGRAVGVWLSLSCFGLLITLIAWATHRI